ncbi:MAG: glycosyltransferase family 4 protein [wastewater metagenome]|nr:glycosyltransferase family 4 protein [Candidatus Loosdrechtia aerotolerans]
MNILMMTNTYKPFVGGVGRSVETFTEEYRKRGHRVVVVAPEFKNMPKGETDVVRVPAVKNFRQTGFSVPLPVPGIIFKRLRDFQPDIVHSHHPYLIGDSAVRVAAWYGVPLIFTFHTFYGQYTHYVLDQSLDLKRFVSTLSIEYANLCDSVFAPSQSVASLLRQHGVKTPIEVVPTGVHVKEFACGERAGLRASVHIPQDVFVVGFVSRIAPEKNIKFLSEAVAYFLKKEENAHFLVVGKGSLEGEIKDFFKREGLAHRLHCLGILQRKDLINAYHSMDVFAFASHTETQGLVVTEAMASGVPVVALDASGVREVVRDYVNGRLLYAENKKEFAAALQWIVRLSSEEREGLRKAARNTAHNFSVDQCTEHALSLYEILMKKGPAHCGTENIIRTGIICMFRAEMDLIMIKARSVGAMLKCK